MCGLAGKLWYDASRPADERVVAAMSAALAHRGPDGSGLASSGPCAFGHRRLAIVDLSDQGAQPMTDASGRRLLVVNGEIYNAPQLRRELVARGHEFRSHCDSEVVLPLYAEYYAREGVAFLDRLHGMFALAIWDADAQRLLLARDRVGQKPLVYAAGDAGISFASELSGLARDPDLDRRPDDAALARYLATRAVPHPATAWRGARRLPPGSALVVEGGRTRLSRYWRLAAPGPSVDAPSLDESAEELDALLARSVRERLMADVPVGAFLSGGIDSAAIVTHMRAQGAEVQTFTIGFDDEAWDERPEARSLARALGTRHTEARLEPDALSLLDRVLASTAEPFSDASCLPTLLVSELAAQHVKVVLTGDGGDEAFAGYDRHRALLLLGALRRPASAPLRAALGVASGLAARARAGGHRSVLTRLRRFAEALTSPPAEAEALWRRTASPTALVGLLSEDGRRRLGAGLELHADWPPSEPYGLAASRLRDVEHYLPDDLLHKLDICSMAHGLEARSPFLDHRILEWAFRLPDEQLRGRPGPGGEARAAGLRAGQGKLVLRRSLARRLAPDLLGRKKRGFGIPIDAWLRGPLQEHVHEVLLSPRAAQRGLFDVGAVTELLRAYGQRELAAHELVYTLLVLERWFLEEDREAA